MHAEMGKAVAKAFKQLLSEKHLYQYIEVDVSFVPKTAEEIQKGFRQVLTSTGTVRPRAKIEDVIASCLAMAAQLWLPREILPTAYRFSGNSRPINFELPTINTFCDHCNERWPFNPVSEGSYLVQGEGQDESFHLAFQCQQCKGRPIRFLVCREVLKIRLAGRYPLEVLPTPKMLPKSVSKYYGNAMIAHHAGQTLAGLFLLRVFIEQFWKTVPAVRELFLKQSKATGDEQGDAYQSALPQDFKSRFPSLKEVYGNLSAAIHSADENAKLFDDSCAKIVKHFEARQLFEFAN